MFWLIPDIEAMIFTTKDGKSFDTERDLTAPERHILQKLFLWKSMALSIEQFRTKKEEALRKGWNNSGPITESQTMRVIIQDLEHKVSDRLADEKQFTPLPKEEPSPLREEEPSSLREDERSRSSTIGTGLPQNKSGR